MNRYKLLFGLVVLLTACKSNQKESNAVADNTTTIQINERSYSFGKLKQSDSTEHVFTIKNTGDIPLIIKSAKAACGCTVPKWSTEPVLPNKNAMIRVKFKPNPGFEGIISKSVVIQANTDSTFHVLYMKGEVVK
ncbi:DUF1573 domain-containing protein [Pedobacter sp. UC225_65]|uniref:DUF1573 domain-containing protein n=1 Tax=Pedobacter sp. UC225_65 TaxID=3350173 RepID=UPI00366FE4FE